MVTCKLHTFVYLNVDYHHQEHVVAREWNDSQFQNTRGGVKVMKFWIVRVIKSLVFGRSKHLKNSSKILANTFSDSLADLNFFLPASIFFRKEIPGFFPVHITLSIILMDSLPVPFPFFLKGGPEPFKQVIQKVLFPIGRCHIQIILVPKQILPYHPTRCISWPAWSVCRSARR